MASFRSNQHTALDELRYEHERVDCALERYIPPQSLTERTHDRRYPLQDSQATPSHELALRRLRSLLLEHAHRRAVDHRERGPVSGGHAPARYILLYWGTSLRHSLELYIDFYHRTTLR